MQGYFQVSSFGIPREPVQGETEDHASVDYIIISRRSKDRAGLRYQRRGVGEEGHVANFVETESIMKVEVSSTHLWIDYGVLTRWPAGGKCEHIQLCSDPRIQ